MRIAFVSDMAYPWAKGGVEFTEYFEAKELAKNNEVHMFCLRLEGMEKEFVRDGIHYHAYLKSSTSNLYIGGRRSVKEAFRFAASLTNLFKYKFDVVQANLFPIVHMPIVKLYCSMNNAKLILDVAEVWDRRYWREYIGWIKGALAYKYNIYAVKGADFYIANSSATKGKLMQLGINSRNVIVFSPFLEHSFIKSIRVKKSRNPTVIISGRMIKEKRIDKFISIIGDVAKEVPGVRAIIIGMGPEWKNLAKLIHEKKLENIIKMIKPFESKKDLYKAIKSSWLMLQMSEREGLSAIVIESIALGTPVILPSYTPIPGEVKKMCLVAGERKIAGLIANLLTRRGSITIKNKGNLERYYTDNIEKYYAKIFRSLGYGDTA